MTAPRETVRGHRTLLAALLLVSFALRAATGTVVLDSSYHFDERFSFRNVSALLVEGSTRPANAYYPSLSYLPHAGVLAASEGLHRLTGSARLSIFDRGAADGYSRTAYLLVRLVSALFGTASIWLTFLAGRRLFDARTGLLAATLLSAVPSHVSHSALFKPDVLVVFFVSLAFLWSHRAVHGPTVRRYLLAGCGAGLAVAAKYTGVAAALPLAVGAAAAGRWDPRAWTRLAAAGAAAVAAFMVLNPYLGTILAYLPRLWRIYSAKGEAVGGSHPAVLGEEVAFLVRNHQLPVVLLAAAGLAWALARAFRRATDRRRRLDALMLLALPVGYSLVYAASTTLFKGQNYLLVTPFTSLLAAWPAVALWDRLRLRFPGLGRPRLAAPVWALVVAAVFVVPVRAVYRAMVPTTFEAAQRVLGDLGAVEHLEHRIVYFERENLPLRVHHGGRRMATLPLERLDGVPEEDLAGADAEVFFARRLEETGAAFYWRRLATPAGWARRLEPGLLELRGPGLVVVAHPWEAAAEPVELALEATRGRNRFRAELPAAAPGERISFSVWLPLDRSRPRPATLRVGRRELPLYETAIAGRRLHVTTPRVAAAWGPRTVALAFEERLDLRWEPRVTVYRWRLPQPG